MQNSGQESHVLCLYQTTQYLTEIYRELRSLSYLDMISTHKWCTSGIMEEIAHQLDLNSTREFKFVISVVWKCINSGNVYGGMIEGGSKILLATTVKGSYACRHPTAPQQIMRSRLLETSMFMMSRWRGCEQIYPKDRKSKNSSGGKHATCRAFDSHQSDEDTIQLGQAIHLRIRTPQS